MGVSMSRVGATRSRLLVASALAAAVAALSVPTASATLPLTRTTPRSAVHKVTVDPRLFGVHDRFLNSLSRPGTGSIRLWDAGTTWAQMQPTPGPIDFTTLDQVVADAWANGTEVTLVVAMTPPWAAADPSHALQTDPPNVDDYGAFVTQVMRHYRNYRGSGRPGIANYQVWNEANIATFWTGTAQQMADLVAAMAQARDETDLKVKVVAPAMVTRLGYQQKWIKAFYALSVGGDPISSYVDALSFNLYPVDRYPLTDPTRPGTPEDSMALLAQVRSILAGDGVPGSLPVWDTEINYGMKWGSNGGKPSDPIAESVQVAYVIRTYLLNAARGVKRVDWYAYDMGELANTGGTLGNTLLTDPTDRAAGTLTAAGEAFSRVQGWMNGTLVGTTSKRPCIKDKLGTYTCTIRYTSGTGRVCWNPYATAKVTLVKSARNKFTEYGVKSPVVGGSKLKVDYRPVLVKSKR
jgi:Beta-galactosidase